MRCMFVPSRLWAAPNPNFVLANIEEKQFGIAKKTVCKKYYILPEFYLRTPQMRILIFQVEGLKCATHSSWIFDTFVCFSEPFFTDKGTGYKHCMCQVLMVDINLYINIYGAE